MRYVTQMSQGALIAVFLLCLAIPSTVVFADEDHEHEEHGDHTHDHDDHDDHDHDHEDHDHHDHGEQADGPLVLTPAQMVNLGITTVTAEIREVRDTVDLIASVEVLPELQANVSPRFDGQVREVNVTLGDRVDVRQQLVVVEPIIAGASTITLFAPISGIISAASVRIGQTVEASSVLFEISDHSRMLLHGTMMESPDITRIRAGQTATVRLDALPDAPLVAEIARFYMAREEGTGLFTVHAETNNAEGRLYPGMMGTMSIGVGNAVPAIVVPRRAILGSLGDRFLFVRRGDEFERREVIEGLIAGPEVEILEGVFPGEEVVTQGHYQLQYMGDGAAGLPTDPHAGHNH